MKRYFFVGWHNGTNLNNGPVNLFNNILWELEKSPLKEEAYIVTPEKFQGSTKGAFLFLLKEVLKGRDKIFLVNGNGLKFPYLCLLLSKLNNRHKFFLISHGLRKVEDQYIGKQSSLYITFEGILIKSFQNILGVSELLKNQIIQSYNRKKPIEVVYSGLDLKTPAYDNKTFEENKFKIILSGGLKRIKGVYEALELVEYIKKLHKPYELVIDIYGNYDEEETYKTFKDLEQGSLKDNIVYKGTLGKEDLLERYKDYDLSLALSYSDTFNLAVLEALAMGLPSIVSSSCGITELMEDNREGLIVSLKEDYKESIVEFLDKIYEDRELYESMSRNAIALAKKQSGAKMFQDYVNVVDRL